MRYILSLPFLIIGASFMKIGEVVSGEGQAWNAQKVLEKLKENAECSVCGHRGVLKNKQYER